MLLSGDLPGTYLVLNKIKVAEQQPVHLLFEGAKQDSRMKITLYSMESHTCAFLLLYRYSFV